MYLEVVQGKRRFLTAIFTPVPAGTITFAAALITVRLRLGSGVQCNLT